MFFNIPKLNKTLDIYSASKFQYYIVEAFDPQFAVQTVIIQVAK